MPKTRSLLYQDRKGEWRWKTLAKNNKTVGAATEGFQNKQDCIDNAKMNAVKKLLEKED